MSIDEENLFSEKENAFDAVAKDELPITYTLRHPTQIGKELVKEIVFKYRPTWGAIDHLPVENQKIGNFRPIVASMTDYTSAQLQLLDSQDALKLLEIVTPFVAASSENGQE